MKLINLEFMEQYFDFIMEEVEKGETFMIEYDEKRVILTPYNEELHGSLTKDSNDGRDTP